MEIKVEWNDEKHDNGVVIGETGNYDVDLTDLPTKPIENPEGFYLLVRGDINYGYYLENFYHFPLGKKDLAMWVFYKIKKLPCHLDEYSKQLEKNFGISKNEFYNTIQFFIPQADDYECYTIDLVRMFMYKNKELVEIVYDENYKLLSVDELIKQGIMTGELR